MFYACTGHRCNCQGCGDVLVLDGNMKNHRSVCYADKAGYVKYEGLPGKLCTGCPNTPAKQSPYCNLHKPFISSHHINSNDNFTDNNLSPLESSKVEPVGLIVGKRTTHNNTLYQVSKLLRKNKYCIFQCYVFTFGSLTWGYIKLLKIKSKCGKY